MTAEECVKEIMKIQVKKEEINKGKEMIKYLSWKKRR